MSLAVLVATAGRPTLARTLQSIAPQLQPGDELLVDCNADRDWGHRARNRMMRKASAAWLAFMDDDDVYTPGALDVIRSRVALSPGRVHLFRMECADGRLLWADQAVRDGNVSTQMVVVPLGVGARWGDRYQGDLDFIEEAVACYGDPVWCPAVVARLRPT